MSVQPLQFQNDANLLPWSDSRLRLPGAACLHPTVRTGAYKPLRIGFATPAAKSGEQIAPDRNAIPNRDKVAHELPP